MMNDDNYFSWDIIENDLLYHGIYIYFKGSFFITDMVITQFFGADKDGSSACSCSIC